VSAWAPLESAAAPLAPLVGPFPGADFLDAWWRHHGAGAALVVEEGDSALAAVVHEGVLRLAGEADLTDYHSPLGSDLTGLVDALIGSVDRATPFEFDSLPVEAAGPLAAALADAGADVSTGEHTVTMTLDLPDADYLARLPGKHRHEVRRKRRRFEESLGPPGLQRDESGFKHFVEMHRAAPGDKGTFMTGAMEGFFRDLLDRPGWVLDVLVGSTGAPVATAVGFEDDHAYYLYNSAFDPEAADASPGIVLCDELIRSTASAGRERFDFLKGREAYKRRFGATPRSLAVLTGVLP